MASAEVEVVQPKKGAFAQKWQGTKQYIYNPEKGEFMGRTCMSWAKIGLFYLIFYACLAGFFGAMLAIFFVTIDFNYPRRTGYDSLIKKNPGMGFRPMPDFESTLIRFEQGKAASYKVYTDHIQAFLDQYENENQVGENYIDCAGGRPPNSEDKVCRFQVENLGTDCTWQQDYGYDEGQPCVLLKLNKVYDWMPETYKNDTMPAELAGQEYDSNFVPITCEGENPADRENIGNITFTPKGFGSWFYPYRNQQGYRQPIVMARFENPRSGVLIQVWCRAWSPNLKHHRNDKAASIHFELLVD